MVNSGVVVGSDISFIELRSQQLPLGNEEKCEKSQSGQPVFGSDSNRRPYDIVTC
jgi:hypothetical protein